MNHPAAVGRGQTAREAEPDVNHPLARDGNRNLIQPIASNELGSDVWITIHLADAVDGDHVGVLQPGDGPSLNQESVLLMRVGLQHVDELDGDGTIENSILGKVDAPHRSDADAGFELIAVKLRRRLPVRSTSGT